MPHDKASTRLRVTTEIVTTEKNYVDQLGALLEVYLNPLTGSLKSKRPVLKEKYVKRVFRNVRHIHTIHSTFLADIEAAGDAFADSVGTIISKFAHFFKMYTDYVNEHEQASLALKHLESSRKYSEFQQFCREALAHPRCKGLNLASLLITPIQRIPRYKLLIAELIKNTDQGHPDRSNLDKAMEIVSGTAKHINEAVRAFQNRKEIQACMDEFVGKQNLLAPHRKFIRKGKLIRQTRNTQKQFKFYLFNDMLIYASQRGWKFRVHLKASIDAQFKIEVYGKAGAPETKGCGEELKKIGDSLSARVESEYPDLYLWKVASQQKSFLVFAPSADLGKAWVRDIKACVAASRKTIHGRDGASAESAPVWQPDNEAKECTVCKKRFGFIRRRHHCRKCGLLVCSDCSRSKTTLSWCPTAGKQRVCDTCIAILNLAKTRTESAASTGSFKSAVTSATSAGVSAAAVFAQSVGDSSISGSGVVNSAATSATQSVREDFAGNRSGPPILSPINENDTQTPTARESPGISGDPPPVPDRRGRGSSLPERADSTSTASSVERFSISRFAKHQDVKSGDESIGVSSMSPGVSSVASSAADWTYFWIPHAEKGFVAARRIGGGDDGHGQRLSEFRTVDGEIVRLQAEQVRGLREANANVREGTVADLTLLNESDFSEGSLLHIIRSRYQNDQIYTRIGGIVVAVNPFRLLPIYTMEILQSYMNAPAHTLSSSLEPHVFAVAAEAYNSISNERVDQSVVISGESGSGKTETTKLILQYLSEAAGSNAGLDQELLQSNPLLEAFGNAKTVQNDNSSRFGKWLSVNFSASSMRMCGGSIHHYLLEKTRVTRVQPGERNFHIFYQMCAYAARAARGSMVGGRGAGGPLSPTSRATQSTVQNAMRGLRLLPARQYHYCNQGGDSGIRLDGFDDAAEFLKTVAAMELCGLRAADIKSVVQFLAAILHLGNIRFLPGSAGSGGRKQASCRIPSECDDDLEQAARLLGVTSEALRFSVENRTIKGKDDKTTAIPLNPDEAMDTRDALAKAIYGGVFDWLVKQINISLGRRRGGGLMDGKGSSSQSASQSASQRGTTKDVRKIGVLDIFGFEIFRTNSLEQLFINYANEKLQQFFNQHVFTMEQALYDAEGINVKNVVFNDNRECLNLLEGIPKGKGKKRSWGTSVPSILKILDESLRMPNPTDEKMLQRVVDTHALVTSTTNRNQNANKHFAVPRGGARRNSFIVKHYAGDVTYSVVGFLVKNHDHVHESLKDLLRGADSTILSALFPEEKQDTEAVSSFSKLSVVQRARQRELAFINARKRKSAKKHKGATTTLGSQFKASMRHLIASLRDTTPHFIRCIKPNAQKRPFDFNAPTALRQMRSSGLVEALSFRRLGFPFRKSHHDFVKRYDVIRMLPEAAGAPAAAGDGDMRQCAALLGAVQLLGRGNPAFEPTSIQNGKSMVFWTASARRALESWREMAFVASVVAVQAAMRARLAQVDLLKQFDDKDSKEMSASADAKISDAKISDAKTSDAKNDNGDEEPPPPPPPRRKKKMMTKAERYAAIVDTKGLKPLRSFECLRPEAKYLKGLYLNRSSARKSRFVFQKGGIPAPLTSFYTGTTSTMLAKAERKRLKKQALSTFSNLLRYTKVRFHAYPYTTGFAVVSAGHSQAALRDEIYCQLIKQTTDCPKKDSALLGFKLIYLCLSAFMPNKSRDWLLSHLASRANPNYIETLPDTAESIQDVATHCIRLYMSNCEMEEAEAKNADRESADVGSRVESDGQRLYVTLELVMRVTRGLMSEAESEQDEEFAAWD